MTLSDTHAYCPFCGVKTEAFRNNLKGPGIDGYYYTGQDGSQMAFWTCLADRTSKEHIHNCDEYMVCLSGEYVVTIDRKEMSLHAGDEIYIPNGTLQGGRCKAGTRTIHAFGGKRVV